ncbi:MAG: threonylcarbamoyl-AMP synthase [Actinomycetia bacterium]|nr:threonylcarbamoyl-AMP synthase [Actinomycetes bacterium]
MKKIYIGQENFSGSTALEKISALLAEGKVGVLPTATIYGLSCRYDDADAVRKIYRIKGRKAGMPFIVLISSISQLGLLAGKINAMAKKLIDKYWNTESPEPLTLVLSRSGGSCSLITGGRSTIAIRMAGLGAIRDIIDRVGPIVSTSATISGSSTRPGTIDEVPEVIRQKADFVVEYGSSPGGRESTIVDITGLDPVLLREGALDFEDILESLR